MVAPREAKMNQSRAIDYPSGKDGATFSVREYRLWPARKISPKAI